MLLERSAAFIRGMRKALAALRNELGDNCEWATNTGPWYDNDPDHKQRIEDYRLGFLNGLKHAAWVIEEPLIRAEEGHAAAVLQRELTS